MKEQLVQFGDEQRLCGVLRAGAAGEAQGLLLLNAGLVHRIGPHRLNVKIARAHSGPSLRFDLSGQGESRRSADSAGYQHQAVDDIRAATDLFFAKTDVQQLTIAGLCSGADNAMQAALGDERIRSLILLDPFAYPNKAAAREDFIARLRDKARWAQKIGALFSARRRRVAATVVDADANPHRLDQGRAVLKKSAFALTLQKLLERGVRINIIYTGLVRRYVSRPAHFFETFAAYGFEGQINVTTMPAIDHTFTTLAAQEGLLTEISTSFRGADDHMRIAS